MRTVAFSLLIAIFCYIVNSSRKSKVITTIMVLAIALGVIALAVQVLFFFVDPVIVAEFVAESIFGEDNLMADFFAKMICG